MAFKEPETVLKQSTDWIAENQRAWDFMLQAAGQYVAAGMQFSIRALCDVVRFHMITNGGTDGYKMNNDLHPCFARMMLAMHPEWGAYLHTRKSKMDEVMGDA